MRTENHISSELKDLKLELPWVAQPKMDIPDGYFEAMPDALLSEIKQTSFWAEMPKSMPQIVPDLYFTENENRISTLAFISELPKNNIGELPENYFNSFETELSTSIFLEQLPKSSPLEISAAYFETFHANLMNHEAIKSASRPKLHVSSRRFSPFSMAAGIILFLGISFLFFSQQRTDTIEHQIAMLSSAEIETYIQQHQAEFDIDLSLEYVDPNHVDLPRLEDEVLNTPLNQLSQDEIDAFLL